MESVYPICATRDISIMRDHDDGIACLSMQCIDEIHDACRIALVEIARGLVCEEIWHIRDECSRYSDALLLTSWELSRITFSLPCESDSFEYIGRLITTWRMWYIEYEVDILCDGQIRYEFKRLEYESNMLPSPEYHLIDRELCDICITEHDVSAIRREYPCDEREKCRLPCTTRTHDSDEVSGLYLPVEIIKKCHHFRLRSVWLGYVV